MSLIKNNLCLTHGTFNTAVTICTGAYLDSYALRGHPVIDNLD